MLFAERLALGSSRPDGFLGRGQRVRGDDGLAQMSFGVVMPFERRVKFLTGDAARAKQIVGLRVVPGA